MANFRTVRGNKATDLDGRDNLYVHCVSKERLEDVELLVLWITTMA
jgi:hypothetical protein